MNVNSRLTFGKHKGIPLKNCPTNYLTWVITNLLDTDFHEWAVLAKKVIATREKEGAKEEELVQSADEFLKEHGIDPKKYSDKRRRRKYIV